MRGFPSAERESVTNTEIEVILDWTRQQMVVRSGCHRETFRLEIQKQLLIQNFNCAYPRLLRQIIHKNPSSQATVFTSKGDFTLFHRNVERAVWLARQNGFEEGPKADEEERTRLLQRKRDGRPRKHVTTPHMTKTYTPP